MQIPSIAWIIYYARENAPCLREVADKPLKSLNHRIYPNYLPLKGPHFVRLFNSGKGSFFTSLAMTISLESCHGVFVQVHIDAGHE